MEVVRRKLVRFLFCYIEIKLNGVGLMLALQMSTYNVLYILKRYLKRYNPIIECI